MYGVAFPQKLKKSMCSSIGKGSNSSLVFIVSGLRLPSHCWPGPGVSHMQAESGSGRIGMSPAGATARFIIISASSPWTGVLPSGRVLCGHPSCLRRPTRALLFSVNGQF